MASILNRLVRVSALTTTQRAGGHCSYLLQHVKWFHDQTHYQHGISGIPTDGKVVKLRNSNTGSQIYLVGTNHFSKKSAAELVKKVINSVRPDAIAIEQSKESLEELRRKRWEPVNVDEDWISLFRRSMRSPGGLQHKMNAFRINREQRRLQADGILSGREFKVAMEESLKLKAKLIPIDQDRDVFFKDLCIIFPSYIIYLWRSIPFFMKLLKTGSIVHLMNKDSRSQIRVLNGMQRVSAPAFYKVMSEDREMHMFTRLRKMEEKLIVAVVGMRHMDGIELLWRRAEDAGDDELLVATSENGGPLTGDVAV